MLSFSRASQTYNAQRRVESRKKTQADKLRRLRFGAKQNKTSVESAAKQRTQIEDTKNIEIKRDGTK